MGVLGDDDIEKIVQTYKKQKIAKIFHDPKKAQTLAVYLGLTVYITVLFGGAAYLLYWSQSEQFDDQVANFNELSDAVINNADCDSLKLIYHDIHIGNENLYDTEKVIKDEIQYRC